jgi:hypothetical protein
LILFHAIHTTGNQMSPPNRATVPNHNTFTASTPPEAERWLVLETNVAGHWSRRMRPTASS